VLLKLNVRLHTLTPPPLATVAWEAQTPQNAREIDAQLTLIQNPIQNYCRSLASLLDKQVKQLSKGAQQIAYNIVLMQEEIGCLRDAVKALTKRKSRKRQYIQAEETLTVGKVTNLIAKKEGSRCKDSKTPVKRVRAERHCSCCGETRYNSRTCKVEIEDADSSNTSK
jgi:excinuclease UvrABC ATPase subunit